VVAVVCFNFTHILIFFSLQHYSYMQIRYVRVPYKFFIIFSAKFKHAVPNTL